MILEIIILFSFSFLLYDRDSNVFGGLPSHGLFRTTVPIVPRRTINKKISRTNSGHYCIHGQLYAE